MQSKTFTIQRLGLATLLTIACVIICAVILRSYDLVSRPFHNDEGVNHFFVQQIDQVGFYRYSHENYHGPSYFYLTYLCWKIFGDDEVGVRASAMLMGIFTLLLVVPLRRTVGSVPMLCALIALAFSTTHIYYSRYAIHETLFLFATCGVAFSLFLWITTSLKRYIYFGSLALALIIATKETFIISLACIGLAACSIVTPKTLLRSLLRDRRHLYLGLLLVILIVPGFFTGGYRWGEGVSEMWRAVPQWIGRNNSDTGHFKPFWYYAKVLKISEPWLILVLILPILFVIHHSYKVLVTGGTFNGLITKTLLSPQARALRFFTVWSVATFIVYSVLNYKTPWLIINITVPAAITVGLWLGILYNSGATVVRWSVLAVCGVLIGYSASKIDILVFKNSYGNLNALYGPENQNLLAYVHTTPGILELASDIEHYLQRHPGAKILVAIDGYWPLPFYLRAHSSQVAYLTTKDPTQYEREYGILIMEKEVAPWEPTRWARKYYRISEVEESATYYKRGPAL